MFRMWKVFSYLKYFAAGLCMALVFSARSFGAEAPLEVEGVIKADTTWSGEVIVLGDVLVPEGVTLTIAPGADIRFAFSESTKIEPMFLSMGTELLVRGRLLVEGSRDAQVVFGPAPEDVDLKKPERGDWGGIIFDGKDSSSSVIRNARFVMADAAVSTFYSSPEIAGVTVEDSEYGFAFMGKSGSRLTGCLVRGCEFGMLASHGARPELKDCVFANNAQDKIVKETP